MKTNTFLTGILLILNFGCTTPIYLPTSGKVNINQYGSYIKLYLSTDKNISGELIAIDRNNIYIVTESDKKCMTIPRQQVLDFKLKYAKSTNYWASIPLYTLATLSHGYWLVISAPLNIIVTLSVALGSESSFRYNQSHLTYDGLKMFARFPQGIPPNIDIETLK